MLNTLDNVTFESLPFFTLSLCPCALTSGVLFAGRIRKVLDFIDSSAPVNLAALNCPSLHGQFPTLLWDKTLVGPPRGDPL